MIGRSMAHCRYLAPRNIVAVLAILAVLFQSLALIGVAHLRSGQAEDSESVSVSAFDAGCEARKSGEQNTPAHGGLACFERCILCAELSFLEAKQDVDIGFSRTGAPVLGVAVPVDRERSGLLGWASSWSSRSPPFLS